MKISGFPVVLALFTMSAICWRVARDASEDGRRMLMLLYMAFLVFGTGAMLLLPM